MYNSKKTVKKFIKIILYFATSVDNLKGLRLNYTYTIYAFLTNKCLQKDSFFRLQYNSVFLQSLFPFLISFIKLYLSYLSYLYFDGISLGNISSRQEYTHTCVHTYQLLGTKIITSPPLCPISESAQVPGG